jgi:sRNA-binding protein
VARTTPSVGRNEPCPCGSGRKYKQCCLDKDEAEARKARAKEAEKAAKEAEKARKAAEKATAKSGTKPADSAGEKTTQPRPPKPQTYQPWKKSATNTHAFQRMTTPRKVGGS